LGKRVKNLVEALGIRQREHIAFVGAGGKSTLMLALAKELTTKGYRVVTSTTTKVWREQAEKAPYIILTESSPGWMDELKEAIELSRHAFLGEKILPSDKVQGIAPEIANELYEESVSDYLMIEADGAAGKPVKAPAGHEPVIPISTTLVVAVIGLDALGKPCLPETVFRLDDFLRVTGAERGEILTPELVAKLVRHDMGSFKECPEGARKALFLNRADLLEDTKPVEQLLDLVAGPDRIIVGSLKDQSYFFTKQRRRYERYL